MSGLVAAHGSFDPDEGRRMLDRLTHRGPDGTGTRAIGESWLGHRRLAIVDLERGRQPLGDEAGRTWLVGDGEIYNERRLRVELEARGHRFRTGSDHESALHLYRDGGVEALSRLWGMFAVVVADAAGGFAAVRDPIGVAPLYWVRDGDATIFASELKAFDLQRRADVQPFPPGHAWTPEDGLHEVRTLSFEPGPRARELVGEEIDDEPPAAVYQAIRDEVAAAVERSLTTAAVPVGAFLSGGLDSSILTAVAAEVAADRGWTLPTFSVGLADSKDLLTARKLAADLGTAHYERVYTVDDLIDWAPEVVGIIESFDPQLVHSSVPNLLVAKLASRHVKIVLIGEGADELFAGYSHWATIDREAELHEAMVRTIEGLHRLGLHRVDRVAGACGIEARIPFLDLDVVELCMGLPAKWKLADGSRIEKWLLRKAFEGWLPDEVLWRPKAQFGEGTGADELMRDWFERTVSDAELAAERNRVDPPLRTREELAYYRMFRRHFAGLDPEQVITRFPEA